MNLKNVTTNDLQIIINFIYNKKLSLKYNNLTKTINTTNHLQISSTLNIYNNYIITKITFKNTQNFLTITTTYSLNKILKH